MLSKVKTLELPRVKEGSVTNVASSLMSNKKSKNNPATLNLIESKSPKKLEVLSIDKNEIQESNNLEIQK